MRRKEMGKDSSFPMKLFYSYCHKDSNFKETMESTLKLLEDDGLQQWSDGCLLPGQHIDDTIKRNMEESDIFTFLISRNFLASEECKKEWSYAKQLSQDGKARIIPVIIRQCSWRDFDDMKDFLVLPQDGKPVTQFNDRDTAWQQIYEGIKGVINDIRMNLTPKKEYISEISGTDFISQRKQNITLDDLFVFPSIYSLGEKRTLIFEDVNQIIDEKYVLIDGEGLSGKTALCVHIFLTLAKQQKPALLIDLKEIERRTPTERVYEGIYKNQFRGDFSLWREQEDITIIFDNLSDQRKSMDHIMFAKEHFRNVIVTVSSDVYSTYWMNEPHLADFTHVKINPLTQVKQEKLLRKWSKLSDESQSVTDGRIDQIENNINSIILSNKILPRYPFYILSILQTYEGFMPRNLGITSYGHCYYVMILAHLLKSGIREEDSEINACINFSCHLAFYIHKKGRDGAYSLSEDEFDDFKTIYGKQFLIKDTIINRLQNQDYGIIKNRKFGNPYMYYYFLGKYLSDNSIAHRGIIEEMAHKSFVNTNCLTLIFIIHHSRDNNIIDEILLRTMTSLDNVKPAILNHQETKTFQEIVKTIPEDVSSNNSVEHERQEVRKQRDLQDGRDTGFDHDEEGVHEFLKEIYRILKNNEILGQILRNKYGNLEKSKIKEIIEIVTDGGLRIIKLILLDEEQINDFAHFVRQRSPEFTIEQLRKDVQFLMFIATLTLIDKTATAVNKPEIRGLVEEIVKTKSTPAYDLVGYAAMLDSIEIFGDKEKRYFERLFATHKRNKVIERMISIKTQDYMNTHTIKEKITQAMCSKLKIPYRRRLLR